MNGGIDVKLLYIDPGTGSMLFTILIGVLGAAVFALRGALIKLRFFFSGGKKSADDEKRLRIVVYSDSKRYWNVFRPICDELEARGEKAVYMTSSPDDPALNTEYQNIACKFIGEGNKAFAKLNMLKADLLLSTTPGLDVYQWKRSKDVAVYAHVLHAVSDATLYRMFGLDYYDAVLLSGGYQEKQIRSLEEIRGLKKKELFIVGQPYMDELLKRKEAEPAPESREKTVLLAPSWGPSAILAKYGEKMIDALLATGYRIIIRPHPQSYLSEKETIDSLTAKYPESERLQWNRDNDNFGVLSRADIMISDFSGVIFDYSLVFGRPVIYADTSFDPSPYDASWLEEETWTFRTLKKIGVPLSLADLDNMKAKIDGALENRELKENLAQAREECWQNRGGSAAAVADCLEKLLADVDAAREPRGE